MTVEPGDTPTSIDVPPHPRLLSVLGDIEFQPWQCIAELIDNAFDEFLRHSDQTPDVDPTVWVNLPSRSSSPRDAEVWIEDNGTGMTLQQLRNALRAGWTSNDRYGSLGLFGVGFNIATARLGHVAIVRTARAEDPVWQVVTIDLRKVAAGNDFQLPVTTEVKQPGEHGTKVVIRELKPEHHEALSRRQTSIKNTLGDVYSYLLDTKDFRIIVDGEAIKPRRACVWGEDRFVVRNREQIPAVMHIDEALPDRAACLNCGMWQDGSQDGVCESCHSSNIETQHRRIWGWVGIQRYLSTTDFGIDFIRNGRKILLRDVSLFTWSDPNEPSSRGVMEYPIEVPAGAGRIVGEIHIDHVRVNYQKNAFEYDTPDWKKVERLLRGEGPLLPKSARELGYPINTSPLARLISGYRRNVPGKDYLTPGDGKGPIHDKTRKWAEYFRKGDPEYQSDEVWYSAVELHDNPPEATPEPSDVDPDILTKKGLLPGPEPAPESPLPAPTPPAPLTEDEKRASWRSNARRMPDMDGRFGLKGAGAALEVTCWLVEGQRVSRADGEAVPIYVAAGRGSAVEVFVDTDHPVFTAYATDLRDLMLVELAEYLRIRVEQTGRSLTGMFYALKDECLPHQKLVGPFLAETATLVLTRIRELMQPVIAGNASGYWSLVAPEDQKATEQRFALEGGGARWEDVQASGEWIDYAPGLALARLIGTRPEAFFDNRVFRAAHDTLTDPDAKRLSTERIADLVSDVASLADHALRRNPDELQRGRLSCRLLEHELVQDEDAP
jgi:hypothetical protein